MPFVKTAEGKQQELAVYEWPIANAEYPLTMQLTKAAHDAITAIIGPNARFSQNKSSKGKIQVSTSFGDSNAMRANDLYRKVAMPIMFPHLAKKLRRDGLQVEHKCNSNFGISKEDKFENQAKYRVSTIAFYMKKLNGAVGGGGTHESTTSTSGILLRGLQGQYHHPDDNVAKCERLKCMVALSTGARPRDTDMTLEELWALFRREQMDYYRSCMGEFLGSLDFSTDVNGEVTLDEMTRDEIIRMLEERFAMPSQDDIDAQRNKFKKQYKKDLKKNKEKMRARALKKKQEKQAQQRKNDKRNQPSISDAFAAAPPRTKKRKRIRITIEQSESE